MPIVMQPSYWILPAFAFFLGACVGSFLNVCIYRIPIHESVVFPPSHCPQCHKHIPFYLNIPIVSYLVLRGKCINCRYPISPRYPIVETLMAVLSLALFYKFGPTIAFIYWFLFSATLVVMAFIDMDHQIIPDRLTLPGIPLFALSCVLLPGVSIWQTGLGILVGGGIPYLLALGYYAIRKQQGLGGGDIKLLAMIGAATGVNGVLFTLFCGSLTGLFYSLPQLAGASKKGAVKIPFGPFLALGAQIYVMTGEEIIQWYLQLVTR